MSNSGCKYSELYHSLKLGALKGLYDRYFTVNSVNMAGGIPLASTFPVTKITVEVDGDENNEFELVNSVTLLQNYTRGFGLPLTGKWIQEHIQLVHQPPYEYATCVTGGSTGTLTSMLTLLSGDCVLFDEYTYASAISTAETYNKIPIGVKSDHFGIIPSELRKAVVDLRALGKTADILYVVPTGHNPCGFTVPLSRKQDVYAVCHELDILIIEDDAYYYVSYNDVKTESVIEGEDNEMKKLPGIYNLPRSFLSIDVDGRVLRIDTISKFIAPGMRIGWITARPEFIEKYVYLQEMLLCFPSNLSQSVFIGLVQQWGNVGFDNHIRKIQIHYKRQRDVVVAAVQKWFTPKECTFALPTAGMFIWLEFHLDIFPIAASENKFENNEEGNTTILQKDNQRLSFQLFEMFAKAGVVCVPGIDFYVPYVHEYACVKEGCGSQSNQQWIRSAHKLDNVPVMRLTYAAAKPDDMNRAIQNISNALRTGGWLPPREEELVSIPTIA